jgi:uncharacterized protein YjiS (DUF1127 family)
MSTIHGIAGLGPITGRRQVYSPFEMYWNAFLEWRKHSKLRIELSRLTDSELADIGISRGEIEHVAWHRDIDAASTRSSS